MSTFFDFPEWMKPRKPISDPNDPIYDPAKHWENDFVTLKLDPIDCPECQGSGIGWYGNHMEPPESCDVCEGSGYDPDEAPPPEPEEIDPELMGVPL